MASKITSALLLLLPVLVLPGCATKFDSAVNLTQGATFAPIDGGEKITFNQEIAIPSGSPPRCFEREEAEQQSSSVLEHGVPVVEQASVAKDNGGIYYRITFTDKPQELYGVLLFCVTEEDKGWGANSGTIADITIPGFAIDIALEGEPSVAFRLRRDTGQFRRYSWIFWLADDLEKLL